MQRHLEIKLTISSKFESCDTLQAVRYEHTSALKNMQLFNIAVMIDQPLSSITVLKCPKTSDQSLPCYTQEFGTGQRRGRRRLEKRLSGFQSHWLLNATITLQHTICSGMICTTLLVLFLSFPDLHGEVRDGVAPRKEGCWTAKEPKSGHDLIFLPLWLLRNA
jgi:hypothetical protein